MSTPTSSGIQTAADGHSFIPSSKRADGSTRKEIRVRPGYRPPEDVERYRSKNAENWRTRGGGGVPGADTSSPAPPEADTKSKNARRREAARRRKEEEDGAQTRAADEIDSAVAKLHVQDDVPPAEPSLEEGKGDDAGNAEVEGQKKIRNHLKKLRAVRELKAKKAAGEKLSADQLVKIAKEQEIVRDLVKLDYGGPEIKEDLEPLPAESRPD